MSLPPTGWDVWVATALGKCVGRWPLFDQSIQSMIRHGILGGFWYAAALFYLWMQVVRTQYDPRVRVRVLTVVAGSAIAILLTMVAAALVSWPPPHLSPGLSKLFPDYIDRNPTLNCFPSQSTAAYGSIAAGMYSLHRNLGVTLLAALPIAVSLPRMYVGGHYLTDVVVGALLALIGYVIARYALETTVIAPVDRKVNGIKYGPAAVDLLVFVWILQVAVEFRDAAWANRLLMSLVLRH